MKSVFAFMLLTIAVRVSGLTCPFFTCGLVPTGACAQKMSSQWIQLSNVNCASGSFCSAQRMFDDWWWYSYTAVGNTYPCLSTTNYKHITTQDAAVYTEWPCLARQANKDLAVGTHPKDCASDHDCLLQDGSYSSCLCGVRSINTNGICQPDISSSLFNSYWTQCNSKGFILNKNLGFYYSVLQRVYTLVQSDVTCAPALLWEFQILSTAQYSMNSIFGEFGYVLPLLLLVVNALI